jgi:hypothetical protein
MCLGTPRRSSAGDTAIYTGTMRKMHRYKRLYCAVVTAGLKLKEQVEEPYMCPICHKGAKDGKRPFKDRRGLFLHLVYKHYGDLIEMVVEVYNSIKRPRKAKSVLQLCKATGEVQPKPTVSS